MATVAEVMIPPKHASIQHLQSALRALERAETVQECKSIRDSAEAFRVYANQAGLSLEARNMCTILKLKAERKAGRILIDMEERGELAHGTRSVRKKEAGVLCLGDLGVSSQFARIWEKMARVPDEAFEDTLTTAVDSGEMLSRAHVARTARRIGVRGLLVPGFDPVPPVDWNQRSLERLLRSVCFKWPARDRSDFSAALRTIANEIDKSVADESKSRRGRRAPTRQEPERRGSGPAAR